MTADLTRAAAEALDAADALAPLRERFRLPDGLVYLDGNSLGPVSHAAAEALETALHDEWAEGLITSWNAAGWFELTETLGDAVGALVGAGPGQVVVTDTTSVNLFKVVHAGLSLRPERGVVVAEGGAFPTDLYVLEGVAATRPGLTRRLEGRDGDTIESLIDDEVAVVLVNQVDYRSGRVRDMERVTARAHAAGAIVVWDLCHSAGVFPVELDRLGADLAVGCTYKYLNGGPGAPAFLYAARRHHDRIEQPLMGWWGHRRPFGFERDHDPDPGIRRFLCGTQPVLSMRALAGSLELWREVDLHAVRAKSMALTGLFVELVERRCAGYGLVLASPRDAAERGSQVSFSHPDGYAIVQALIERRVIGDFRAPDVMRFGFAPLYLRFVDVWDAVERLRETLESGAWRDERYAAMAAVT